MTIRARIWQSLYDDGPQTARQLTFRLGLRYRPESATPCDQASFALWSLGQDGYVRVEGHRGLFAAVGDVAPDDGRGLHPNSVAAIVAWRFEPKRMVFERHPLDAAWPWPSFAFRVAEDDEKAEN